MNYSASPKYLVPSDDNAFDCYQEMLNVEPGNTYALNQIRQMAINYKTWGAKQLRIGSYQKAETFYQRYILIAAYLANIPGKQDIKGEINEIEVLLADIRQKSVSIPIAVPSPAPTFTPSPTPIEGISDSIFAENHLSQVEDMFSENIVHYETLVRKEQEGQELSQEIIRVLEDILTNLKEMEQIGQQLRKNSNFLNEENRQTVEINLEDLTKAQQFFESQLFQHQH